MPIYEFYCPDCHTVFSFLSRSAGNRKLPSCPRCDRPRLRRKPSTFAVSRGRSEPSPSEEFADAPGLERAMEQIAQESEGVAEDDPRAAAKLMRRFHERTGLPLGDTMDEAIRRLEAGEDPERVEQELGDLLEQELPEGGPDPAAAPRFRGRRPPIMDDGLYEL